jgi:glycerol-3-phosphate dehydrogenase
VDQETCRKLAPNVGGIGGMLSPNTAIFDTFLYTVALAENALKNGVEFFLNHEVTAIDRGEDGFTVTAGGEQFKARMVINSAGLYSDKVAALAGVEGYHIYPCRGEYLILDTTTAEQYLSLPIYPAPRAGIGGLGVHLPPSLHGNILIGPNAEYIDECDDYETLQSTLDQLFKEAQALLPVLQRKDIVASYRHPLQTGLPPRGRFPRFCHQGRARLPRSHRPDWHRVSRHDRLGPHRPYGGGHGMREALSRPQSQF